jgi:hypothetical protein
MREKYLKQTFLCINYIRSENEKIKNRRKEKIEKFSKVRTQL